MNRTQINKVFDISKTFAKYCLTFRYIEKYNDNRNSTLFPRRKKND